MIPVLRRAGMGLVCAWLAAGAASGQVKADSPVRARDQAKMKRPAIVRLDVFVAMRYDENAVLVIFTASDVPAAAGVPVGDWPHASASWMRFADVRLVRYSGTERWAREWPGGTGGAPQVGDGFALALGGGTLVRGELSNQVFLPLCGESWMAGLVTVRPEDRDTYRQAAAEAYVAYPLTREMHEAVAWPTVGPVLPSAWLDAMAQMKVETALRAQRAKENNGPVWTRDTVPGQNAAAPTQQDGAPLSYTAQRVRMPGDAPRYFVSGLWREETSGYRMTAWFTEDWKLESVVASGAASDDAVAEDEHIVNVFTPAALPMLERSTDGKDREVLMDEGGLYSVKQWRPGRLTETGISFEDGCR